MGSRARIVGGVATLKSRDRCALGKTSGSLKALDTIFQVHLSMFVCSVFEIEMFENRNCLKELKIELKIGVSSRYLLNISGRRDKSCNKSKGAHTRNQTYSKYSTEKINIVVPQMNET